MIFINNCRKLESHSLMFLTFIITLDALNYMQNIASWNGSIKQEKPDQEA